MKTLFQKQQEAVDFHLRSLAWHYASLDTSSTGVGKTVIASAIAAQMKLPVTVVCPKIVVPHWGRELEEAGVTNIVTISNYEKLRRGGSVFKSKGRKTFDWVGPTDSLVIWDEVHRCRGAFTQNSAMLIASVQAGNYNLMLSATSFNEPPQMRAIGYALGLHNLHKSENGKPSWFSWMKDLGCRKDPWNNWTGGIPKKVREMGCEMYKRCAHRLSPYDLPNAFAENHIIVEPMEFSKTKDINKAYEELGLDPVIIERLVEGEESPAPNVLTEILRARQLAEGFKIPDIADMVKELREENVGEFSVVVFLNFRDSVDTLVSALNKLCPNDKISIVVGGQNAEMRETHIQQFQNNFSKIMICNIAAGGVGVSLHDTHGGHPRISLISPTFNFEDYTQALGRIHRAGAKSHAQQRILVANGTVEERVLKALERKRIKFNNLHQI